MNNEPVVSAIDEQQASKYIQAMSPVLIEHGVMSFTAIGRGAILAVLNEAGRVARAPRYAPLAEVQKRFADQPHILSMLEDAPMPKTVVVIVILPATELSVVYLLTREGTSDE